jgi:FixJ family two-component response regulator
VGSRAPAGGLTPTEQQVAELAASGMKNRDVAAALFISPKRSRSTSLASIASSAFARGPNWAD